MSNRKKLLKGVIVFFSGAVISSRLMERLFKKNVEKEVKQLFESVDAKPAIVSSEDLKGLPTCVQKWQTYSEIIGKEKIISVRSRQTAKMRLTKNKAWLPLEAEQYFTTEDPGFIWKAKVKAAPCIHISGDDKYVDGKGSMSIKLQSFLPIAESTGIEIDQGSLLRYLAEMVWFPSAVLNDYVKWKEVDDYSAEATMTYGGVEAAGTFTFNNKGEVIQFEAERYGEFNGAYSLETWSITMGNYQFVEGIKVPTEGQITWKLKDGDFLWYTFTVEDIQYNFPQVY